MAGNTAYKLGIVISADASSVKPSITETQNGLTSIGNVASATETKMQRLIATAAGLHSGAANSNQKAWTGALAAEGLALDNLRAKYNPLFSVISQYRAVQTEIRTAHAMGAISADEMTAAIQRQRQATLASIDAIKGRNTAMQAANSSNSQSFVAQNAMFQFQDIGMTAAMGMNPAMIALQQGSQLAGAFSGQSLKQTGASIASAFTMLLSPTALATVAVTGLTAAAIQYGMKWFGTAKDLSKTISDHEEQIKRLREAYQYAGSGADDYYRRVNAGARFGVSQSRSELQRTINEGSGELINQLGGQRHALTQTYAGGYFNDDNSWQVQVQYKDFEEAILQFQETIKKGEPDILGFRKAIEDRWNLDPNNEALTETTKKLLELAPNATAAALALEQVKQKRADFMREEARRRADEFTSGLTSLRGIAAPQLSDRRQVEKLYATAANNSTYKEDRIDASVQRDKALARINEQEQRQIELAQIDIQLQMARDPLTRAELTAKRERITLGEMEIDTAEMESRVRQARNQVMAEAIAQSSIQLADMQDEIVARRNVTDATTAGTMSAADAQIYLQAESELRPLIAAAARAEGEEKQKLLNIINQMVVGYQQLAVEQKRASAVDYIRSQQERIAGLKVELAIVGETGAVRQRVMAQLQAEQEIRRRGLATGSSEAATIRAQAVEQDKLIIQLEKQADAWRTVRQAGESAIDGLVDKISSGDFSGALSDFSKEISKTFLTIGVTNPLKNAMLGTNYGTIQDVGGLSGIMSRLFGGGEVDASGIIQSVLGSQAVGSMAVTAANVTINGIGGAGGNVSRLFNNANDNPASTISGSSGPAGLTSQGGVAGQMWNFFAGKGLKDFQVAAILGHGKAESAFNPLAVGDGGDALGLFQWNDRREKMLNFVGGRGNLGDVGKQLEFAWHELQTTESASLKKLLASNNLHDATAAFGGFERPFGYSAANPTGMHNWNGRLSGAEDALAKFGNTATAATQNLGTFGGGLENIAQNLLGAASGGTTAGGSSGLSGLFSSILSLFGYSDGGFTGPGAVNKVAGIVHAGEVVWSQRDVQRAGGVGVVEAMRLGRRGYDNGGTVRDVGTLPIAAHYREATSNNGMIDTRPVIQVINNSSAQVPEQVEETTNGRGQRQFKLVVSDMVGDGIAAPGGKGRRTMQQVYGMRPSARRRS